ncbi:MAG: hypothetical protein DSY43_04105 [Gammaproteobacteria bacterium]|nr:MAG: hypothetical protein DSY43_04105 [Gammaproteobacteria bacterium]
MLNINNFVCFRPSPDSCSNAARYFGKPNDEISDRKCSETAYPDICTFQRSSDTKFSLKCNPSVCKDNEVTMGVIDSKVGIITKWEPIKPFNTENAWKFIHSKIQEHHDFCFVKCQSILQVLVLPRKIIQNKSVDKRKHVNINIVVLDCISRPHFYRMMRKTVDAMRRVVYDETIKATVLDFELFQSISMHTFDNIRPLFNGMIQGESHHVDLAWCIYLNMCEVIDHNVFTTCYQTRFSVNYSQILTRMRTQVVDIGQLNRTPPVRE